MDHDPLGPARGCTLGLLLGLACWATLAALAWHLCPS